MFFFFYIEERSYFITAKNQKRNSCEVQGVSITAVVDGGLCPLNWRNFVPPATILKKVDQNFPAAACS